MHNRDLLGGCHGLTPPAPQPPPPPCILHTGFSRKLHASVCMGGCTQRDKSGQDNVSCILVLFSLVAPDKKEKRHECRNTVLGGKFIVHGEANCMGNKMWKIWHSAPLKLKHKVMKMWTVQVFSVEHNFESSVCHCTRCLKVQSHLNVDAVKSLNN